MDDASLRAELYALISVARVWEYLEASRDAPGSWEDAEPLSRLLLALHIATDPPGVGDVPLELYQIPRMPTRATVNFDRRFLTPCLRDGIDTIRAGRHDEVFSQMYGWQVRASLDLYVLGLSETTVRCDQCGTEGSRHEHFTHLQLRDSLSDRGAEGLSVSSFLDGAFSRRFEVDRAEDLAELAGCTHTSHGTLVQSHALARAPEVLVVDVEPCEGRDLSQNVDIYEQNGGDRPRVIADATVRVYVSSRQVTYHLRSVVLRRPNEEYCVIHEADRWDTAGSLRISKARAAYRFFRPSGDGAGVESMDAADAARGAVPVTLFYEREAEPEPRDGMVPKAGRGDLSGGRRVDSMGRDKILARLWNWYDVRNDCAADASMSREEQAFVDAARAEGVEPGYIFVRSLSGEKSHSACERAVKAWNPGKFRREESAREGLVLHGVPPVKGKENYVERLERIDGLGEGCDARDARRAAFLMEELEWYPLEYLRRLKRRLAIVEDAWHLYDRRVRAIVRDEESIVAQICNIEAVTKKYERLVELRDAAIAALASGAPDAVHGALMRVSWTLDGTLLRGVEESLGVMRAMGGADEALRALRTLTPSPRSADLSVPGWLSAAIHDAYSRDGGARPVDSYAASRVERLTYEARERRAIPSALPKDVVALIGALKLPLLLMDNEAHRALAELGNGLEEKLRSGDEQVVKLWRLRLDKVLAGLDDSLVDAYMEIARRLERAEFWIARHCKRERLRKRAGGSAELAENAVLLISALMFLLPRSQAREVDEYRRLADLRAALLEARRNGELDAAEEAVRDIAPMLEGSSSQGYAERLAVLREADVWAEIKKGLEARRELSVAFLAEWMPPELEAAMRAALLSSRKLSDFEGLAFLRERASRALASEVEIEKEITRFARDARFLMALKGSKFEFPLPGSSLSSSLEVMFHRAELVEEWIMTVRPILASGKDDDRAFAEDLARSLGVRGERLPELLDPAFHPRQKPEDVLYKFNLGHRADPARDKYDPYYKVFQRRVEGPPTKREVNASLREGTTKPPVATFPEVSRPKFLGSSIHAADEPLCTSPLLQCVLESNEDCGAAHAALQLLLGSRVLRWHFAHAWLRARGLARPDELRGDWGVVEDAFHRAVLGGAPFRRRALETCPESVITALQFLIYCLQGDLSLERERSTAGAPSNARTSRGYGGERVALRFHELREGAGGLDGSYDLLVVSVHGGALESLGGASAELSSVASLPRVIVVGLEVASDGGLETNLRIGERRYELVGLISRASGGAYMTTLRLGGEWFLYESLPGGVGSVKRSILPERLDGVVMLLFDIDDAARADELKSA